MEPEVATDLIQKHLALAQTMQENLQTELQDKSLLVCLMISAASLAQETEMEAYDFLQLADTAYQILGLKPEGSADGH